MNEPRKRRSLAEVVGARSIIAVHPHPGDPTVTVNNRFSLSFSRIMHVLLVLKFYHRFPINDPNKFMSSIDINDSNIGS
jgi:hypothetical protein